MTPGATTEEALWADYMAAVKVLHNNPNPRNKQLAQAAFEAFRAVFVGEAGKPQ